MSYGYDHHYDAGYGYDHQYDHQYYDEHDYHNDAAAYPAAPAPPTVAPTVSTATCGYNCGVFLVHMDTQNPYGFVCDSCQNAFGAGVPSHHCTNCNTYDMCEACKAYYFPNTPAPAPLAAPKPAAAPAPVVKKQDFKSSPFWQVKAKVNAANAAQPACFVSHDGEKIRMTISATGQHQTYWKITPTTGNLVTIAHPKEPRFLSFDAQGKLKLAALPAGKTAADVTQWEFCPQKDNTFAVWGYGSNQGFVKATGKVAAADDHALVNGTEKEGELPVCQFTLVGATTVPGGCCLIQ